MEEFLGKRDYTGAMAVLEFNRHSGQGSEEVGNKQARKSSEDTHFTEYARFEKVWAG